MLALNLANPANLSAPLNRGLVSWWMAVNQGPYYGGARFFDLLGKNHGTLTNGPLWAGATRPGGYGAIHVSGGTDDVETATIAMGSSTTGYLAGWVYRSATGTKQSFGLNVDSIHRFNVIWFSDNNVYFQINNNFPSFSSSATGWHHLAIVFDANGSPKLRAYFDGAPATTANPAESFISDGPMWIGRETANGYGSDAMYDDVRLGTRAPSDAEMLALYAASRTGYRNELNWIRRSFAATAAAASATKLLLRRRRMMGLAA